MRKFQDQLGRFWEVELNSATLRDLKKLHGIDLFVVRSLKAVGTITEDPVSLTNALWTCCKDQAAAAGIDERDFYRGFAGDALLAGADALIAAWIDFQPDPECRTMLRAAVTHARARQAEVYKIGREAIQATEFPAIASEVFLKQLDV